MYFLKANVKDIGFDDRKLMLIAIPILICIVPYMYYEESLAEYVKYFHLQLLLGFIFVVVDWSIYRWLLIKLRRTYPKLKDTFKRISLIYLSVAISAPIISCLLRKIINYFSDIIINQKICILDDLQTILTTYFIAFGIVTAYEAIYFFMKYKEAIQEKERLQTAHVQSQLDNLRNQINPHFLFNSLNTLMNLIPKDQDRAMSYLDKLSSFYRYSVGNKDEHLVSLKEEFKNAKIYADLLKERFGENINISFSNGILDTHKTLPMSLQLLIENAVKHNIVSKSKPLNIQIYTDQKYIYVKNNLQKKIQSVNSTGMGLNNIRDRYKFFTDSEIKLTESAGEFEVGLPLIKN